MPYCSRCGKEVSPGAQFCPSCGAPRGEVPAAPQPAGVPPSEADLRAFVGEEKAGYYLPRFAKFTLGGVDNFTVTWHWPAFLAGFWWMLYRKMYLWAAAVFVSHWIPYLNFLAWIGWPMVANYLYFKEAGKKVSGVRAANPGADIAPALAELGGVNRWVWPVAIVVSSIFLLLALLLGALGCLAIMGGARCGGGWGNG